MLASITLELVNYECQSFIDIQHTSRTLHTNPQSVKMAAYTDTVYCVFAMVPDHMYATWAENGKQEVIKRRVTTHVRMCNLDTTKIDLPSIGLLVPKHLAMLAFNTLVVS